MIDDVAISTFATLGARIFASKVYGAREMRCAITVALALMPATG